MILKYEKLYPNKVGITYGIIMALIAPLMLIIVKFLKKYSTYEILLYECVWMTMLTYSVVNKYKIAMNIKDNEL